MSKTQTTKRRQRIWLILSIAVSLIVIFSSVVGAILLDTLLLRPVVDGGSVTTLLPGAVYGSVLVMKVCIGQTLVLLVNWLLLHFLFRRPAYEGPLPIWSVFGLIITPLVPLGMAIGVLVVQSLLDRPDTVSIGSFQQLSRTGVFVMVGMLLLAVLASVAGIVRREKPHGLAIVGLVTNVLLLSVFRYWEFYKLGFDQDRWNDIARIIP